MGDQRANAALLKDVIDPEDIGEAKGPARAKLSAEAVVGLIHAFLQPQVWKTGEITSRIRTYVIVSPLFLPDGSRYAYPSIEVEIINNSLQGTF